MKKFLYSFLSFFRQKNEIISNEKIDKNKIKKAKKIILNLQKDLKSYTTEGYGPFLAAIYDKEGNLIAKEANSVVKDNCSNCHAEINTIKKAQEIFNTYDLSEYELSIYVTSEPCIMCLGAIIWSGIKEVYFGTTSNLVEKITGFDEGFKPNWLEEFKKRDILVYGNIESEAGKKELQDYIKENRKVYKPKRG